MEIKVEGKNKKYSELVKDIYCGKFSDLTSFLFFKYASYLYRNSDSYFSNNMSKISSDSGIHLDIFGRIITLLGGIPSFNNFINDEKYYLLEKDKLIEIGIRLIKEKIIKYTNTLNMIKDNYIEEILKNFIIEERRNLEIIELLQLKYKHN
ncbi:MAG: hypothetical protein IKE73_02920 [Bacilli bacterium]|nr:hypothetical protein [Bacilli bacterium]